MALAEQQQQLAVQISLAAASSSGSRSERVGVNNFQMLAQDLLHIIIWQLHALGLMHKQLKSHSRSPAPPRHLFHLGKFMHF